MKFDGHVIRGAGRGEKIGFPTVNVDIGNAEYEAGVFAVRGKLEKKEFTGIAHFGPRPTFSDEQLSVEIHIFDFGEGVGEGVEISFETVGERIRGVMKFGSEEELKEQIEEDCGKAKENIKNKNYF